MNLKSLIVLFACFGCAKAFAQHAQVQQALTGFSADSAYKYVSQLSGMEAAEGNDTIKRRLAGEAGNEAAFRYIRNKLLSWNLQVDSQVFSATGKNLLAKKQGTRSDRYILIGGHYDAVGTHDINPPFYYPGADDNASGVAAVMEAARVLGQYDWPYTIKFAFWDEEEEGLLGSKAFCPPADMENFMGYYNMDMIAFDDNNDSLFEIHTGNVSYSTLLAQRVVDALHNYNIGLEYRIVDPGDPSTDHQSFWLNNLPAAGINEVYQGIDFNPNWHQPSDSITKFNLPYFYKMVQLVMAVTADCVWDTTHVLALNNATALNGFSVYPNPAQDLIYLDWQQPAALQHISVSDAGGRQVYESSTAVDRIDVSALPAGIYLLGIQTQAGSVVKKIVVY